MSGKQFCRLCLNEVFVSSTNMYSTDFQTRGLLVNIFPGLNMGLTDTVRLCEECFNNVNFVTRVNEGFLLKKKEYLYHRQASGSSRNYCRLCFRFETPPFTIFLRHDNYPSHILKEMIEIALSVNEYQNADTNICGECWSWIKKIYNFKRQCFKMEETLKYYCIKRNLFQLKDGDLEHFLQEQYYIRTGRVYQEKPEREELIAAEPINLSTVDHQVYFEATGEIYPNLHDNVSEKVNNEMCFEDNDIQQFGRGQYDEASDTTLTDNENNNFVDYSSLDTLNNSDIYHMPDGKQNATADVDDEFNEETDNNNNTNENNIIVIDDEDDTSGNYDNNYHPPHTNDVLPENFTPTESMDRSNKEILNEPQPPHTSVCDIIYPGGTSTKQHTISNNCPEHDNYIQNVNQNRERTVITWSSSEISANSTFDTRNGIGLDQREREQTVICCDTPQYSELYNRYVTKYLDPSCQIVEDDCSSSVQYVTNIYNINVLPTKENEENNTVQKNMPAKKPISETDGNGVFNECRNNIINNDLEDIISINIISKNPINTFDYSEENEVLNPEREKVTEVGSKSAAEDLVFIDDDCFEVIGTKNNIVDLTNFDSVTSFDLTERGIFGCYVCAAKFIEKSGLRKHLLYHEEPWNKYGRFQCRGCPFRANWKGSVTRHEYFHSRKALTRFGGHRVQYMCPYCSAYYAIRGEIQSHMNEHVISWKQFQCLDCMFTTNLSGALRMHYRNYHNNKKDPSYCSTQSLILDG